MKLERLPDGHFLVFDAPLLLDWCAARIPHVGDAAGWHQEGAQPLGVSDGRDILAVLVTHGYEPQHRCAQMSMAAVSSRWASRSTVAKMISYPLDQLGCQRLTTLTPASNRRALRFNVGLGFKQEGLCRRGFGDEDCIVMGLLKEELSPWARLAPTPRIT